MKYFKNTELAKLYHVSEKSIRNWIDAAESGKLDLQLYEEKGKFYITNITKNTKLIEELVKRGKKFKNTRGYKVAKPTEDFYKLYSPKQVLDIMSNIDIYREVPVQYTYFDSGAKRWDTYTQHLLKQDSPNSVTNTIDLLGINLSYIDTLIEGYTSINIIDIGPGNALPIRNLLGHFLEKGKLNRYIALDISKELLKIAEDNIEKWFDGQVKFEGHIRDIVYERFDDLLVKDTFAENADSTLNLVLFLGGTFNNFRDPDHALATIHDSMGKKDILVSSKKLDTEKSRRYFEQTASGNQDMELVLRLLNIDKSYYTLEQYFDVHKMARELQAKFNVALAIEFQLDGQRRTIELNKGESLLLWRARHQAAVETINQFDANGFDFLQATRSKDLDYILHISKIKTGIQN
ncbi:MAG TPA: L-histidine N(alpha)-methyltransferase [Candidatus Saccharimonadales bacterium]